MVQVLNLDGQLKALHKAHEGSKLNLTQAIEACNFATKKRRAAERQLAKLQVLTQHASTLFFIKKICSGTLTGAVCT